MHHKNGREAKNGDEVVFFRNGAPITGILYDAVAGNDTCNGRLAEKRASDAYPNLAECLHVEDVKSALGDISKVADTSKIAKVVALVAMIGVGLLWPVGALAQDAGAALVAPAVVSVVAAPLVAAPTLAPVAAPALSAPQSLMQEFGINHLLTVLALALLGWAYKDLNPHLKTFLAGVAADPKQTALAHTFASIGTVLDDLAESAAGHILTDPKIATDSDVHDAATDMMKDAVDGMSDDASNVAEQYLGTSGKQLVDYLVGLVKKKVADAEAAGAAASAAVQTAPQAAVAIDAATKKA